VLAQGRIDEIRALLSRHPRRVELRAREGRRLARAVLDLPGVRSIRLSEDGSQLSVETSDLEEFLLRLGPVARETKAGIRSLETSDAGLEAVFDYLVS
jgi:ABC-2 type transport system ATP-binding protein